MEKVKIAILGTGTIANTLAIAMQKCPMAKLYAVASRSKEKAEVFAEKYGMDKAYGSYEEVLADSEIQLVYIAVPHSLHYPLSKMCLEAGKNVLCEKPVSVNKKQAAELFDIAKKKGLFMSEAMWTRFLPSVGIVQKKLSEGCIGEVKHMTASIGFEATGVNIMSSPDMAGGILLDCGIYLLTAMDLLLGDKIESVTSDVVLSEKGVDLRSTNIYRFADGKTATLIMSMDCQLDNKITVNGTKGYMEMTVPFNWQDIKIYDEEGRLTETVEIPKQTAGGYEYEVAAVCDAVLKGKTYCEEASPEKSLYILKLMDDLRNKWGMKYPFE